ncbi:TetR/AcrR family transcriptional regulator C-terminal domain-containing protein [Streptomyces sp. NPDC048445]|uniref:TetR/AcrR family transcriptional regulator C-terminal domain-containing protein n=1 Tax=Streptomyces sp. NPDC048445 TaxID=3365553 RepID=UPI0037199287
MGTTKIDRSRVADTALRLLNEVGLDGLTLRAIARELDVKAPALYWHFKDKQALLDEMATVMHRRMVEVGLPGPTPQGWQEQLVAYNLGLRRGLLRYRDGAKVYGGAKFTGTDYADGLEGHLRTMVDAGFELWQAVRAGTTAYSYTMGFVSEEQGVRPMPDQQREGFDVTERAERLARYPLAAAAGSEIFVNYDERFEDGLRLIIAGIEARYGGAEDPGRAS